MYERYQFHYQWAADLDVSSAHLMGPYVNDVVDRFIRVRSKFLWMHVLLCYNTNNSTRSDDLTSPLSLALTLLHVTVRTLISIDSRQTAYSSAPHYSVNSSWFYFQCQLASGSACLSVIYKIKIIESVQATTKTTTEERTLWPILALVSLRHLYSWTTRKRCVLLL